MDFDPVLIWFVVGLLLIVAEFVLPGVILVFFGIGAWIASLTTWIGLTGGFTSQIWVFVITSILLLVFLRRWFRARFFGYVGNDQDPENNLDDMAGNTVTVTEAVGPDRPGKVEYKGAAWTARSESEIAAGQTAVIVAAEGITLIVRPVQE